MILSSLKWYWVELVRSRTDSYITIHMQADSKDEAEIFARRKMAFYDTDGILRNYWVVNDSDEIPGCPTFPHEEYQNIIFWEEDEDSQEHERKFYIVLFPGARNVKYMRNISRRPDFISYIEELETCIL